MPAAGADGLDTWGTRPSNFALNLYGVTHGQGRFVAVGMTGKILISTNGAQWQNASSGVQTNLFGVAFGGGCFVAVGAGGTILRSADAQNWSAQFSAATQQLNHVAYHGDLFLATGESGTILTSPDGAAWTPRASGTTRSLMGSAHGNGTYVVVGKGTSNPGTVLSSSNAVDWVDRSAFNLGIGFYTAAFGNGVFVAMDARGVPYTSKDGVNWIQKPSVSGGDYIYGMAFAHGLFVAAGGYPVAAQRIATSTAGASWKVRPFATGLSGPLRSITYGNGSFIGVGEKGIIVQSGPIMSLRLSADGEGTAAMILEGETGRTYAIQVSSNLTSWAEMLAVTNTAGTTVVEDPGAAGSSVRLYRAVTSVP